MKNVLVVDDQKEIREAYTKILEKEGFKVLEAGSAVDARELIKNTGIDLVLLDLNMPGIRGDELFQVIKAFHKSTKVIVSSVYPIDEQKRAAPVADDYFDKSEGTKTLINKVKNLLYETE